MVKKFGIEGLLTLDVSLQGKAQIESSVETEEARVVFLDSSKPTQTFKVFDNVNVEIRAEMVEYRRTVQLILKL